MEGYRGVKDLLGIAFHIKSLLVEGTTSAKAQSELYIHLYVYIGILYMCIYLYILCGMYVLECVKYSRLVAGRALHTRSCIHHSTRL